MVIQDLQAANQTTIELAPDFAPESILPAFQFSSAFSTGFAPTAVVIDLYGSLAIPAKAAAIVSGLLLGLSGCHPTRISHHTLFALLNDLHTGKPLHLNGSIPIPFRPAEHIILHNSGLTPSHPDGIRLTAYHHLHPLVTREYYATPNNGQPQISFTEC